MNLVWVDRRCMVLEVKNGAGLTSWLGFLKRGVVWCGLCLYFKLFAF